ncbi:sulfatase [Arenibacter palladensis]|uniref:sulfatase family protein n=1 Tax=Arenibacter palladensis TaxID=237373 RepID=UPI002FD095AB
MNRGTKFCYDVILKIKPILGVLQILVFTFILNSCKAKNKHNFTQEKPRPNIVLFLADDMTWRDSEPNGNPDVKTPHIKKLASEGISLDNMFTSTAMCAPTRQQLMTGLFPVRSGAFPNHSEVYDGVKSLAHYFGDLGYRVALVGKQHYGPETSFPMEYLGGRQHDSGKDGADIDLRVIEPIVNDDRPFFLIVAQNQPHSPWNRGNPGMYDPDKLQVPDYMEDTPKTREGLSRYYAEITYMDSLLGKTLEFVEIAGKTKNTISIFTSEQGYSYPFGKWTCYDLGLKTAFIAKWLGKIHPGTRNKATTQYVDVLPTLLEAIGEVPQKINTGIPDADGNRGFDGHSFLRVLMGETELHREYTYGIQTTRGIIDGSESYPIRSVRSDKYRYIQNLSYETNFYNIVVVRDSIYKDWIQNAKTQEELDWVKKYQKRPYEELYDLEKDPFEKNNLAGNSEMTEVKKELSIVLENWMNKQGDKGVETEMEALNRQKGKGNWMSHDQKLKEKSN